MLITRFSRCKLNQKFGDKRNSKVVLYFEWRKCNFNLTLYQKAGNVPIPRYKKKGCPLRLVQDVEDNPFSIHYGLTNRKHAISPISDKSAV